MGYGPGRMGWLLLPQDGAVAVSMRGAQCARDCKGSPASAAVKSAEAVRVQRPLCARPQGVVFFPCSPLMRMTKENKRLKTKV